MNAGPPTSPSGVGPRPAPRSNLLVRLLFWPLVLTSLGVYIVWRLASGQAVARLERAARDRGEPITIAELAATYPKVPPGSNAYSVLIQLWRSEDPPYWEALEKGVRPLPDRNRPTYPDGLPVLGRAGTLSRANKLSEASLKAAEEFLSANADHLAALHEALEKAGEKFAWHEALRRSALTALAIERPNP